MSRLGKRPREMVVNIEMGWSTHMPVLIKLAGITTGAIMEVGSGIYSTPLLHWLCDETKRSLVSYERNKDFIKLAREYESENHIVRLIDNYLEIPNTDHYSIIFIDHSGHSRGKTVVHFKNSADYVVIHDSNHVRKNLYHLAFPEFKYRKDYDSHIPWTTVLSNTKRLNDLW